MQVEPEKQESIQRILGNQRGGEISRWAEEDFKGKGMCCSESYPLASCGVSIAQLVCAWRSAFPDTWKSGHRILDPVRAEQFIYVFPRNPRFYV
jgi:hypothetical protein